MSWNAVGMFEIKFLLFAFVPSMYVPHLMDQFCICFVITRFMMCPEGQKHWH